MTILWIILKVFGDVCMCFAILDAFPGAFGHSYSLFLPAILCACGAGGAAALKEKGKERLLWLALVLPVSSLFIVRGIGEVWILLPVVAYTAVVILRGQLTLEYYSYRQYFLRSLTLLGGLYLLLSMFSFMEGIGPDEARTIFPQSTLRFGLVYLLTGVILLRQLRLGMAENCQGNRGQMIAVLGGTGLVLSGFVAAEPMLRKGVGSVFKLILTAVFSLVIYVFDLFASLLNQVELQAMNEQIQQHREEADLPVMGPVYQYIMQSARTEEEGRSYWYVILVLAVLAAAMFLMLKMFRRKTVQADAGEIVREVSPPSFGKKEPRRSNRGKVRHYYREFLKMERKRGLKFRKNMTTADILEKISPSTDTAAATELREIYLYARYNDRVEITPAQVDAARDALKRSRGGTAKG